MNDDENATLTMKNVELTVSGWIFVRNPPGSYAIEPDAPLGLGDVLRAALEECGLGDRLQDIYRACDRVAEPRFAKRIAELEAIRQRIVADADAASLSQLDQIEGILNPTGGLSSGSPNPTPVRGTEGEQHLPHKDPKKTGKEKKV